MREQKASWQQILATGFKSGRELRAYLGLSDDFYAESAEKEFSTRVPRRFVDLMEHGNPMDPLLLQVLPRQAELGQSLGLHDPLQEAVVRKAPGIIHKYHGRILLIAAGSCAINCRYCFRRHFPYADNMVYKHDWQEVGDYLAVNPSVHEVILSGGDPLLLVNEKLVKLFALLENFPQVRTLRLHTRLPIVLPERIDDELLGLFASLSLKKVMVMHCNHPQEIDVAVMDACAKLHSVGMLLLNQSVLLRDVNDNARTLAALSEKLFSADVLPYYLHLLDQVQGALHFDIALENVHQIYRELQALLPGYLVPRLVREEPGQLNKIIIAS